MNKQYKKPVTHVTCFSHSGCVSPQKTHFTGRHWQALDKWSSNNLFAIVVRQCWLGHWVILWAQFCRCGCQKTTSCEHFLVTSFLGSLFFQSLRSGMGRGENLEMRLSCLALRVTYNCLVGNLYLFIRSLSHEEVMEEMAGGRAGVGGRGGIRGKGTSLHKKSGGKRPCMASDTMHKKNMERGGKNSCQK